MCKYTLLYLRCHKRSHWSTLLTAGAGEIYNSPVDLNYYTLHYCPKLTLDAVTHLHTGIMTCRAMKSQKMHI